MGRTKRKRNSIIYTIEKEKRQVEIISYLSNFDKPRHFRLATFGLENSPFGADITR